MKKMGKIFTILLIISILTVAIYAKPANKNTNLYENYLSKILLTKVTRTLSNISNWSYWMYYDGKSGIKPDGTSGGIYPRGTAGVIFEDGFIIGGLVDGSPRVVGQTYVTGTVAGWITESGPVSRDDERVKIWRIRPDYKTLTHSQLVQDAAELNMIDPKDVTEDMTKAIMEQYAEDWENWPGDLGAPFIDKNGNGVWDGSDVDEPGIANADQVVWFVCNDMDKSAANALYGSDPIGLEIQVTAWAYAQPGARLGQIIFKRYRVINKSGETIENCYVAQWCDPDVGDAGDDLLGCDTVLGLGFAYNGYETDNQFAAFGLAPSAIGYDFFQGPLVEGISGQDLNRNGVDDAQDYGLFDFKKRPGYINIPMTTFAWFSAGSDINDPELGDYTGTLQWYNMLRGYKPFEDIDKPEPWYVGNDPNQGTTKFPLAGDPVTGEGDVDGTGKNFPPGDRRMALCSGPFTFAPDDTQDIVVAIIGGSGDSRLSSVTDMKQTDLIAQKLYDEAFEGIPKAPSPPNVNVITFENEIVLDWGFDHDAVKATEETVIAGYEFEGYNVYQLPSRSATKDEAVRIATFDKVNGVKTIMGIRFLPEFGQEVEVPVQYGTDRGVQRHIVIDKDYINSIPLYEGNTYYFAVTAYNYNPEPELIQDKAIESPLTVLAVTVQEPKPGDVPQDKYGNSYEIEHVQGTADMSAEYIVVDPYKLTGHNYEIYFHQAAFFLDVDGQWKKVQTTGKRLAKDVSPSTITGYALYGERGGTYDLKFILDLVSPDYNYAEGVKLRFPEGIEINSASCEGDITAIIDSDSNIVLFGREIKSPDDLSGAGVFSGGEVMTVNIDATALPISVDYVVYDDGWATLFCSDPENHDICEQYGILDAVVRNAEGTCIIDSLTYALKTANVWSVKDLTTNEIVLSDQRVVNGIDWLTDEEVGFGEVAQVDGIQIKIYGSYKAPIDFTKYAHINPEGEEDVFSMDRAVAWLNYDQHGKPFIITSYLHPYGWASTAYAADPDVWGCGTTDMDILQKDIELRFTGVYDEPYTVKVNGVDVTIHPIKDGTGSLATIVGARNYSLVDHPLNPNPGSDEPFLIRIPFEVWNVDDNRQISIVIYDRIQNPANGGDFYAFNPSDRMYCFILDKPYDQTISAPADVDPDAGGSDCQYLTWNLVFWNCDWNEGDRVVIQYDNPIQIGKDVLRFSTTAPVLSNIDSAKKAVEKINVFPNPYYAYNALSDNMYDNYVTFTHLPAKATIRIFTLSGIEVRKLEKNDPSSQFLRWDLKNEKGLPVASGLYIAYIDLPDLNKHKILKFFIIQSEQILEYY
ncbi:MAG: hypothetical protein H0Z29_07300 [Candidatus Marinimicrobia bacterium]|nr:hypothetical protein [Candidatus Neomarinimicrobiota bacterium]